MMTTALSIGQFVISLLVLAVAIGRWGGKLEGRREVHHLDSVTKPVVDEPANGRPSVGELSRRLQQLEDEFKEDRRNYLPRSEADERYKALQREREDLWGAVKDLRTMDAAQQRRIDALMQT